MIYLNKCIFQHIIKVHRNFDRRVFFGETWSSFQDLSNKQSLLVYFIIPLKPNTKTNSATNCLKVTYKTGVKNYVIVIHNIELKIAAK